MLRTLCGFFVALLLSVGVARADFTFIHTSDTHVGVGKNAEVDAMLFAEMSKMNPKPVLVVTTGDVCDIGGDDEYAQWRKILENLGDIKMYVAPGNHDVRWNPRGKEGYTRGTEGPLYRSWDYENVHFVTLDSTVLLEHWGHFSQDQLDWLKADLEKVGKEKPVVIGFHHWIGREEVMVDNEQALMELVAPYNVVLWLQGHGHKDIDWSINGVPAIMVAGLYQGSYNFIDVTSDQMKIRKRLIPKKEKKEELLQDHGEAATQPDHVIIDVMTIPLKKQSPPPFSADAKLVGDEIQVSASSSELPGDAKLECRLNSLKYEPMSGARHVWTAKIPAKDLSPGEHIVTVQATINKRSYQKPVLVKIPGAVAPIWEVNVGGAVQSRLVRSGEMLYVTTMGGDMVALTADKGGEKFRVHTDGPIFSTVHVDNGMIYFGSADHHVYAVEASSGQVKWKRKTGGAVLAGPAVAKGVVCVGSVDTFIYGIDAATSEVKWKVPGKNMFQSKTATDGERFFVGGWDNIFRCIDAATGDELWKITVGRSARSDVFSVFAPAITAPTVGDGKVYVSSNDGVLHAFKITDGTEAWRIDWKSMGYSSPWFHKGKVFGALSDKGKVFAVASDPKTEAATTKPASGETVNVSIANLTWEADAGSVIYDSSFIYGAGQVYIGSVSGVLSAFDSATGARAWQYSMGPGHLLGSPAADDKCVYMGSMSGKVIALPAKGK